MLGTFFELALSNVGEAFEMEVIPIAVVDNEYYKQDENLKTVITNLSQDNEYKILDLVKVTEDEAGNLLERGEIDGYVILNEINTPKIVVKENGLNQTILKSILDEYYQVTSATNQAIEYNQEIIYNGVLANLNEGKDFIIDISKEKVDFSINYFFTLIAMACLYGSLIGLEVIKDCEANLSQKGAREIM